MTQGFGKQVAVLSPVEAELHLRQIPGKMLGRDLVPRSHDAALEQRERRFDGIGMHVAFDVNASRMLDGFVLRPHVAEQGRRGIVQRTRVTAGIVRNDHFYRAANVLLDELRQRAALNIVNVEESQIAAALPDSEHDVFVRPASALSAALDSANIGFVQFDRACQGRAFCRRHCEADAMAQVPRRLVAHADGSLELIRRHALSRLTEQQDSKKPSFEGELRIPEDRACGDAKLVMAGVADQNRAASRHIALAPDTFRSDGPAQTLKQVPAAIFIGETRHEITKSHSSSRQKASRRDQKTLESKGEGGLTYRPCRGLAGRPACAELRSAELFKWTFSFAATALFCPIVGMDRAALLAPGVPAVHGRRQIVIPIRHVQSEIAYVEVGGKQIYNLCRLPLSEGLFPEIDALVRSTSHHLIQMLHPIPVVVLRPPMQWDFQLLESVPEMRSVAWRYDFAIFDGVFSPFLKVAIGLDYPLVVLLDVPAQKIIVGNAGKSSFVVVVKVIPMGRVLFVLRAFQTKNSLDLQNVSYELLFCSGWNLERNRQPLGKIEEYFVAHLSLLSANQAGFRFNARSA
jgi:hypothetical protein